MKDNDSRADPLWCHFFHHTLFLLIENPHEIAFITLHLHYTVDDTAAV